eukprot:2853182-Rhodomonas_salina.2
MHCSSGIVPSSADCSSAMHDVSSARHGTRDAAAGTWFKHALKTGRTAFMERGISPVEEVLSKSPVDDAPGAAATTLTWQQHPRGQACALRCRCVAAAQAELAPWTRRLRASCAARA